MAETKTTIFSKVKLILDSLLKADWKVVLILAITATAMFWIYSSSNVEQTIKVGKNVELLNQNTEILNNSVKALTDRLETYENSVTSRLNNHDEAIEKLIECVNDILNKKENEIEKEQ